MRTLTSCLPHRREEDETRSHLICERNLWVRKQTTSPVYVLGVSLMLASLGNITRSWKGVVLQSDVGSEQKQAKFLHALPMQPPLLWLVCTHLLVSNTFTHLFHLCRGTAEDTLIWHSLYHPLAQPGIGDSPLCWGSWEDGDYFCLNNWVTATESESLRAAWVIKLIFHLPPTPSLTSHFPL